MTTGAVAVPVPQSTERGEAPLDVHAKLDEITALVEGARAMPISASCIVNRTELLAMLDELRALLPGELSRAAALLRERDAVIDEGRTQAARLLEQAAAERARMVSRAEVVREAEQEAERVRAEAYRDAERTRVDVDDYVDGALANFEVVLHKTLAEVERGRARLVDSERIGDGPADGADGFDDTPLPD